jgi:hypothetical protein
MMRGAPEIQCCNAAKWRSGNRAHEPAMLKIDESKIECHVLTYKEGCLSAVAHDLKLAVTQFSLSIRATHREGHPGAWEVGVESVFEAGSLKTVCAMKEGRPQPGALSLKDRRDIERNISASVLKPEQYPLIRFSSTEISGGFGKFRIRGKLTLCGVTRTVTVPVVLGSEGWEGDVVLDQRDYGITPYRALLGAMKVKPEVKIQIAIRIF